MAQADPNNVEQKFGYGVEELQVVGEQLLAKVKELVHEGNVRRIIIKQDGHSLIEFPLSLGVASIALAPVWAALGVLGALISNCSIEVIRTDTAARDVPFNADPTAHSVEEIKLDGGEKL
ncbi:DUF4342 domain-containing protein [Dictyobacter arantiisoli]|uniref:DUF4342 domain-containing protein n=1 Tax=Dictyobacter arantiisoli TaxID=2014874 RepID=A0A5A5TFB9_9CHLR|nr:DUF4342 domain-containing protein [Dictyobacter arantiisoli]GCF09763.1 hypothetical protein KDI_33270 [Dictyobacter arantiisoli]